jgi:hypothetical protein
MTTKKPRALIMSNPAQDQSSRKQPKKKPGKVRECPQCGADWKSGYIGWLRYYQGVYCANCGWNQLPESIRVTKDLYAYWYRIYRIKMRSHQIHPPKWKQPLDLLMDDIGRQCARNIPYWMKTHLDEAHFWYHNRRHHYWIFQSTSRWKYHLWLKDGYVKNWAEYQAMYKAQREWEADHTDYSDYYGAEY